MAVPDKLASPLFQGHGRDAVGTFLKFVPLRLQRLDRLYEEVAVADGDDFGLSSLDAVDDTIVSDDDLPYVVSV